MGLHSDRIRRFLDARLYLVTSADLSRGRSTIAIVQAALAAGVRLIQLREKTMPLRDLYRLALDVRSMTRRADALMICNDRLDLALAVEADGVHLGQQDLPIDAARRIAPNLILGASTHNEQEAHAACEAGASYINIGPIFPTRTKTWTDEFLGLDGLRRIAPHAAVPFTVMGGITIDRVPDLAAAGARTLAVVTAVTAADDPEAAARDLLESCRRLIP